MHYRSAQSRSSSLLCEVRNGTARAVGVIVVVKHDWVESCVCCTFPVMWANRLYFLVSSSLACFGAGRVNKRYYLTMADRAEQRESTKIFCVGVPTGFRR